MLVRRFPKYARLDATFCEGNLKQGLDGNTIRRILTHRTGISFFINLYDILHLVCSKISNLRTELRESIEESYFLAIRIPLVTKIGVEKLGRSILSLEIQ